jgi:predicted DsbA family dithiol-disulfide isomerase
MHLDIYADVTCPWCYIGKRRLERALAMAVAGALGPQAIAVQWRPFLLNPGMPPGGMDRKAYLAWKFGGTGRVNFISDRITQEGREDGIPFAFDRITRTPNTVDAHRTIAFAQERGDAGALVEALFAAYFTAGRDIGARDELIALGRDCGLDGAELAGYLDSGAGREAIVASNDQARSFGINAVPCFVFDGREALAGAQPPEVFLRLFEFARRHAGVDNS